MKEFLRKLREEKGEVSVEWALVAVIMAAMIVLIFSPGIKIALTGAIAAISNALTTAAG